MTMQRRALASFTGSMYEDEFKLIVPVTQPETDYIAKMMGPLKPFTYPAWFWILFSVLYFSVSFSYIERRTMLEETEEDEYSLTNNIAQVLGVDLQRSPKLYFMDRVLSGLIKSSYEGLLGFTSMAPVNDTASFPGRVLTSGFVRHHQTHSCFSSPSPSY